MDNTLLANIITEITPTINSLIFTILGVLGWWLGLQAKRLMNRIEQSQKIKEIAEQLEVNHQIVQMSVDYAEQIGGHLKGTQKFRLAKDKAHSIMLEWGIEISEAEIEALIEQVVRGYNAEEIKIERKHDVYLDDEFEDLE